MPRQGIMLCSPFDITRFGKWGNRALLQPKYNGERCRAVFNAEGKVDLLSSEMHVITGVPHLVKRLQSTHLRNLELDGELYTHMMDFSLIRSIASRKNSLHPNYEALGYTVFDIVNPHPQEERLKGLNALRSLLPLEVGVAPTLLVDSLEELRKHIDDLCNEGYEGVVLRREGSLYERKRSTNVMKFKPHLQDLYKVVGWKQEIDIRGTSKQALGAFICQGEDGTPFGVGSGPLLTRDNRQILWQSREHLNGMHLLVKYQSITTANHVPLFPVALELWTEEEKRANDEKEGGEESGE